MNNPRRNLGYNGHRLSPALEELNMNNPRCNRGHNGHRHHQLWKS
jgi:hypothetical protein